jgi:hypothetical protein
VFGRESVTHQLAWAKDKVSLLLGDAGVGKSTVLAAAQQARRDDAVVPSPIQLTNSPGGLQLALLEALGAAVADLATNETAARRAGRVLADAGRRLAEARLGGLRAAVANRLLDIVGARLGETTADLIRDFAAELRTSVDEQLAARISAASDKDVIDLIVSLSRDVEALADGKQIILALDDAHRLGEDDLRRLADLVVDLPAGTSLRASFTTWDSESRSRAEWLIAEGVGPINLLGLSFEAVTEWLIDQELPSKYAGEIIRVTAGYGLHVAAAIGLLHSGEPLENVGRMSPNRVLAAQTSRAWRQLDSLSQLAATKLSVMSDPLPSDRAARLTGLDLMEWNVLRGRLVDSGIFTGSDSWWFHELRRRYIWDNLLDEAARSTALRAALAETREAITAGATPEAVIQFGRLSVQCVELLADDFLTGAASASREELAVAAALIELEEPQEPPVALDAEDVLLHARIAFEATGDLVKALHQLSGRGLVYVASAEHTTAAVATWRSNEVYFLLAGRAAAELGRLPTPRLATALFKSSISPRLGSFKLAKYGIGAPSIGHLALDGLELLRSEENGIVHYGRKGPTLVLRASHGGTPFYGVISYDRPDGVGVASAALDGLTERVGAHELRLIDVLPHPMDAVPSRRFVRAAEIIVDRSLGSVVSAGRPNLRMAERLPLDEEMSKRAALLAAVRGLCSAQERLAYHLEEWEGYLYFDWEDGFETALVRGRAGAYRLHEELQTDLTSPFHRFELAQIAELSHDEHLGLIAAKAGRRDEHPLVYELGRLQAEAIKFNKAQRPVSVHLDAGVLEEAVGQAQRRLAADLAELLPIFGSKSSIWKPGMGHRAYLLIDPGLQDTQFAFPSSSLTLMGIKRNTHNDYSVRVKILPADCTEGEGRLRLLGAHDRLFSEFGIDSGHIDGVSLGVTTVKLAGLLGHMENEVRIEPIE